MVITEQDTAYVLNTFFSNVVTNLKVSEYADYDPMNELQIALVILF